ncbi:hypothetical protein P5G60_03385 [Paenibacillus jamilae]|nr:hypothetical protein [Paenibacillus jamilae]
MTTHPNIFRWHIKGVRITGNTTAVIDIYIPGVNQQDRVDIRLNLIDRLRGIDIEQKTLRTLDKWILICHEKNIELDRAGALSRNYYEPGAYASIVPYSRIVTKNTEHG